MWTRSHDLNCNYSLLFKDNPSFTLIEEPLKYRFLWLNPQSLKGRDIYLNKAFKWIVFDEVLYHRQLRNESNTAAFTNEELQKKLKYKKSVFLESDFSFFSSDTNYLYPTNELKEIIEKNTRDFNNTIGLHIRRTDHFPAIEKSPLSAFIESVKREIATDPDVSFYLSTDSIEVKEQLIHLFANRIITGSFELTRTTVPGVQNALVDLYSLSKTKKIIGSYGSSFSEMASKIGGIKLEYALVG